MKSSSTQTLCTLLSFSLLLGCQNASLTESPAPEASQPSPAASAQPVAEASTAPATPSPTPTPEILSDLEYSARVMSAFEAQQKETVSLQVGHLTQAFRNQRRHSAHAKMRLNTLLHKRQDRTVLLAA